MANLDIIRRIAERGLKAAQRQENSVMVDCWQHLLDELEYNDTSETVKAFRKFAEKVTDPKYKNYKPSHAISAIVTEIAEELEVEAML